MPQKVATGAFTVLSINALKKTLFSLDVLYLVHIVESAITNIQQNLGYKIMLITALKCLLYSSLTHCTLCRALVTLYHI